MLRRHHEILYAFVTIVVVTALYATAYRQAGGFPAASGLVGHGIGIVGFILMLMTATLYTMRKLRVDAGWGSMAGWLRFHMYTGIVGPYMVLLHTAMRFHGLAALAMALTIVVVISGFVGRYIYTALPRTVKDTGRGDAAPDRRFERLATPAAMATAVASGSGARVSASAQTLAPDPSSAGAEAAPSETRTLDPRVGRLAARRRRLATWRSLHVPLTWALLVVVVIHMVGALYYVVR
jgi:hypothetical protein